MSGRLRHFLFISVLFGILFFLHGSVSSAQSAYFITLGSIDTNSFPHLTAFLDVHDPAGEFVHGLTQQDITLQENNLPVQATSLVEKKPGVQFVIAIAPAATFTIRDASGVTRYEYLLRGLLSGTWSSQAAGQDDFSLLTVGGPQLTHSSDPSALRSSLESFQLPDTGTLPSLDVLASALLVASDATVRPGMERAILFITAPLPADVAPGLQSIMASAIEQNIHIFVWLVAPHESFSLPEITQLSDLAGQTHASIFSFSHDEAVPDLESILEPLRYVYQIGYDSQTAAAGVQQLVAQVNLGGAQLDSQPVNFELNLQSPAVVIAGLPGEIERTFISAPTAVSAGAARDMQPQEQQLSIRVTFPDGYSREITLASLYVDGVVVAENTTPPFDRLTWDLRPYVQDETHIVRVDVVDALGMVGQSNELSVHFTVPSTTQEVVTVLSQKRLLVVGIVIFISASILALVLVVGGRIRPKPYPGQSVGTKTLGGIARLAGIRSGRWQSTDPVTQPVRATPSFLGKTTARIRGWLAHMPWFYPEEKSTTALAYLVPLTGTDDPTLPATLDITTELATLGSDPIKASHIIESLSIEGLHAIIRREGKTFFITDAGSVAGTWVNYTQVPAAGSKLKHADIIHLGRVGFRFNLSEPGSLPKITVTPLEPGI